MTNMGPLKRLIQPFARVMLYDRSGLGKSEDGIAPATASLAAEELSLLLRATAIAPPYTIIAHSYGGLVAREFLHLHPQDVTGMVLVDTVSERRIKVVDLLNPAIHAIWEGLDEYKVTGIIAPAKLTPEEWEETVKSSSRNQGATEQEMQNCVASGEALAKKDQYERQVLGQRPLSVMVCNFARDVENLYRAGIERGNGTEEQRAIYRDLIKAVKEKEVDLKKEQLQLSARSRFCYVGESSHNIQMTHPERIFEELKWVLSEGKASKH